MARQPDATASPADIAIVGAGAAGLMAAIAAGRTALWAGRPLRIVLLDGAGKVGVKILVAGGGRCNVTHHVVDERQYAGTSRNSIRKVLRGFTVQQTIDLFAQLGVTLKKEPTGKLFPTTDRAQTVLDALLNEVHALGVRLVHPWRVGSVQRTGDGFLLGRLDETQTLLARRLILCTGGKALPRSGSDGGGYRLAQELGHQTTQAIFPALVPVVVGPSSAWLTALRGVSCSAGVEVRSGSGRRLVRFENDLLCTHFGLSGPAVMDASRYLTEQRRTDPNATLWIDWLPGERADRLDDCLLSLGRATPASMLRERLPDRLARALCEQAGVEPSKPASTIPRQARKRLAHALVGMPIEVVGDRGFSHAETTAGGVPLTQIDPATMASRACPGLWLAGEILDADGRIGGFNFQWAWSSGHLAGRHAALQAIADADHHPADPPADPCASTWTGIR
ncbi:MAG: aminoacetone oxidase family FAD-binding enzyme [Phycisphaerales bacterium]|nr:MAG: aminoacetone oxidase family FAD-binding enzyme [Phycisphaerales bacterium]